MAKRKLRVEDIEGLSNGILLPVASLLINKISAEDEAAADFNVGSSESLGEAFDTLMGEFSSSMRDISLFVPSSTITRHNSWLAVNTNFLTLLEKVSSLVGLKLDCESMMVAGEGNETGSATGSGLGDLNLAQARKRMMEEELYRLLGASCAEQSSSLPYRFLRIS